MEYSERTIFYTAHFFLGSKKKEYIKMGKERILVMNLGSTSSKIAVYDDDKEVFNDTIRHSTEELAPFGDVTEQYEFRSANTYGATNYDEKFAKTVTVGADGIYTAQEGTT